MEQQKIETLSVKQAVDELRALGIKTSPDKIRAGILQGAFPFGVCIKMENFECEIYRVPFEKWIAERVSYEGR